MARQTVTKSAAPGAYATAMVAVTFTAADATNKEQIALAGNEVLIAHNSGASAHNVTITSVADPTFNRTGNITKQLAAGEYWMFGPMKLPGWQQTDGKLYFEADHAEIKWTVITIPGL